MSRMLGYLGARPVDAASAVGVETLGGFAALARVHADGWGIAETDRRGAVTGVWRTDRLRDARELTSRTAHRAVSRVLYVRFASAGSPTSPANIQPFVRHGLAFAHNGLLTPRDLAAGLLSADERGHLRGTTDSELYFALLLRELLGGGAAAVAEAAARATARLRALYPDACLNALILSRDELIAVQSSADRPPPLAAFAARGHDLDELPPGHGDDYNRLEIAELPEGTTVVSTSGVLRGERRFLPQDSVTRVTTESVRAIAL